MKGVLNILVIIVLLASGYYIYNMYYGIPDDINVSLGNEFMLEKKQTAILTGTKFSVTIENLLNSPCNAGVKCIWDGKGIIFLYKDSGKELKGMGLMEGFGYKIEVLDSDYNSFTKLKIIKQ